MSQDPWLLTPGPLTTSMSVKQAMLHDWGSRDAKLRRHQHPDAVPPGRHDRRRGRLYLRADAGLRHLRGRGHDRHLRAAGRQAAGADQRRLRQAHRQDLRILQARAPRSWNGPRTSRSIPPRVAKALADDPAITHVAVVHCETTSGVLNPIAEVARVVAAAGRKLLIDAMSAFGAHRAQQPGASRSTPSPPRPTNASRASRASASCWRASMR